MSTLHLLDLVAVEAVAGDRFVSAPTPGNGERLGGSDLLAAGLLAAAATRLASLPPASVQASFLKSGRRDVPVGIEVGRAQDGRSSSVRSVTATQDGAPLMIATFRFYATRDAAEWQPQGAIDVAPEHGEARLAAMAALPTLRAFDVRCATRPADDRPVIHPVWMRHRDALPDDPLVHAALILYLTDLGVSGSARAPGTRLRDRVGPVTLDHSLWWHRDIRADDWLRIDAAPVSEGGGRATARGEVAGANGVLAATFSQDVALPHPKGSAS